MHKYHDPDCVVQPLRQDSLDNTSFGVVANLDFFFEKFIYCREVRKKDALGYEGRNYPHPPGFFFMGAEGPQVSTWIPQGSTGSNLYVRPKPEILKETKRRCCEGRIGSFKLIPWHQYGHALILAYDAVHIAQPWLGFIPLDSIPILNTDTVAFWDGVETFEVGHEN